MQSLDLFLVRAAFRYIQMLVRFEVGNHKSVISGDIVRRSRYVSEGVELLLGNRRKR